MEGYKGYREAVGAIESTAAGSSKMIVMFKRVKLVLVHGVDWMRRLCVKPESWTDK